MLKLKDKHMKITGGILALAIILFLLGYAIKNYDCCKSCEDINECRVIYKIEGKTYCCGKIHFDEKGAWDGTCEREFFEKYGPNEEFTEVVWNQR